jgi:hypothetical protein
MGNYCYLAAVQTPERIRVVRLDKYHGLDAGDLILLSDRQLGTVVSVTHVSVDGDDHKFIGKLTTIEEDWIEYYTYGGVREEAHEPA